MQQGAAIAVFNFYTAPSSQMGRMTDSTEALIMMKCTVALRTDSTEALIMIKCTKALRTDSSEGLVTFSTADVIRRDSSAALTTHYTIAKMMQYPVALVAYPIVGLMDGGMNQAYSRLSTTHGHITDCKFLVCMYWTRLVLPLWG